MQALILVCGEALVDAIEDADGKQRMMPGGGPFNTARALARLGVPTAFLGHLSNDPLGRRLAELLAAEGASLALATTGPEPTTVALAAVDSAGMAKYSFLVDRTAAPNLTREMLPEHLAPEITAIHVGTLGLVLEPMASTLTGLVEREGAERVVMLDPNIRPALLTDEAGYRERLDGLIAACTIVKASESDLHWLYPELGHEAAAERILKAGARLVIVTLGPRGAFATDGELLVRVDAPQVNVVDTIGAGDAFSAAFLAWLYDHDRLKRNLGLSPDELRSALACACQAASLTCARGGAEPPTRAELDGARADR